MQRRTFVQGGLAGCCAAAGLPARAQAGPGFPAQPVRFISPFPAGSGPDVVARAVGERMGVAWKQAVVVDPRPGANGFLAAAAVKQAAPTGYDLLLADVGHLSISPSLFRNLPYDPRADYTPVGGLYRTAFFVVVGAGSPLRTLKDLATAATSAASRKLSYASNSVGGPLHLGGALVASATGAEMLHVPYKETAQLYAAVATGEVDWAIGSLASTGPLLRAGKLRLLAVADTQRSPLHPEVPTVSEALPGSGVVVRSWVAVLAPRGTPAAVVQVLNRSLQEALVQPDVQERLKGFGFEAFVAAPAEVTALIDSDARVYAEVIRRNGVSVE